MPRIRQKAAEYREKDFLKEIEKQKIELGIRYDVELAELLGVSKSTLCQRKHNLDSMTVGDFRKLVSALQMKPEMVLPFLGMKANG